MLYRNTLPAFTGERDWQSTILDLNDYLGQDVQIRYLYVSLRFREPIEGLGWFIDDFELYERKALGGNACLSFDEGDDICSEDFTLVDSDARSVPVTEVINDRFVFSVSPNPADQYARIQINSTERFEGKLRIIGIDGRILSAENITVQTGENSWDQKLDSFSPGLYFIELTDRLQSYTVAFIKQ